MGLALMPHRTLLPSATAGPYSSFRLFEWCMATMMVLIAVNLALPGDTMERAALKPIADLGFSEANMATFFGCVGAVRIAALYFNGYINNGTIGPKGAFMRAGCAAACCLIMAQLCAALIYDAFSARSPSFFIPVFGTLAAFEALSVYVAIIDGVSRRGRLGAALSRLEQSGL